MFLHVGNDILVNIKDIIGIFDIENSVVNATEDLPKSYVVAGGKDKITVYISSISTQVLSRRANSAIITA